jgi:hypothetical protein
MKEPTYEDFIKALKQSMKDFSKKQIPDKLFVSQNQYEAIKKYNGLSDGIMKTHFVVFDELEGENK